MAGIVRGSVGGACINNFTFVFVFFLHKRNRGSGKPHPRRYPALFLTFFCDLGDKREVQVKHKSCCSNPVFFSLFLILLHSTLWRWRSPQFAAVNIKSVVKKNASAHLFGICYFFVISYVHKKRFSVFCAQETHLSHR